MASLTKHASWKKRLVLFFLTPFLILGLSGCIKYEITAEVSPEAEISLSYSMLIGKELFEQVGVTTLEQFQENFEESLREDTEAAREIDPLSESLGEGWTEPAVSYSETEKEFVITIALKGTPGLESETGISAGEQDGTMFFSLDLEQGGLQDSNIQEPQPLMDEGLGDFGAEFASALTPEFSIMVKMPGKIVSYTETNAKLFDEQTIVWEYKDAPGKLEVASEIGTGGSISIIVPIALTILLLLGAVGAIVFVLNKKKDNFNSEEDDTFTLEDENDYYDYDEEYNER